jgi:PAS domain S-box-containing protein/diguanylate cyclase (GGDEF)-like protein
VLVGIYVDLQEGVMTNYMNSIMKLFNSSSIYSGDIQMIIDDYLYTAPAPFSVDRVGLWMFDQENKAYICKANMSKGVINDELLLISEENQPSLFEFIQETTSVLVANRNRHESLDIRALLSTLEIRSLLLIPLCIKDNTRGFVFLGNNNQIADWSDDALSTAQLLAQLFIRSLIISDNNALEIELQHQNQVMIEMEKMAKVGGWDYEIYTEQLTWTDEVYRIYGLSHYDEISAEKAMGFFSNGTEGLIELVFNRAITHLEPYELELPFTSVDCQHKWVRLTGKIRYTDQIATHVYGTFEDITEQKDMLASKVSISNYLKGVVDNIDDCIITIFANGNIKSVNKEVEKSFGYSPYELIGQNLLKLIPDPFSSSHGNHIKKHLQTDKTRITCVSRELPAIKKDGTEFPIELSINQVLHDKENEYICIIRDISDKKKAELDIHNLAYYDETTSVLNRYSFERDLQVKFNKSLFLNEKISVMLIDVDKFAQINLAYGEAVGDYVLRLIAKKLINILPSSTQIYRNNADTFYILIDNCHKDELSFVFHESLAKEILKVVNQTIYLDNKIINILMSIGILHVKSEDIDYMNIKPLLELAVFNAKKQGGNCYVSAASHDAEILKRHSQLSQAMMSEWFTEELGIVLQPQYSTDGAMVGSEALVRWHSALLGHISPNEFIPLAEKNGAIITLGDWVIDKTCLLLSQRRRLSTLPSPISINVSVQQIAQPLFCDHLLTKLAQYKIPHSELTLELTENVLIADFNLVISKMKHLKLKGIHFSIDDFGTGYSSLSYIHHLPISELKIDKLFVDDIKNAIDEVPIINTIIQLAKSLNLKVVAEGVECKEQLDYLKTHQCDVIQGFYFSKPLNPDKWLEHWTTVTHKKNTISTYVNNIFLHA